MIKIEKIYKKDANKLIERQEIWTNSFLSISKFRLLAHLKNPNISDDDIILLIAYLNEELVGYMGLFLDKITINNKETKIGWLSTWWVHPKTKGKGVGREILNTMYQVTDGQIGISQFTPSAKRVYDKSGYFTDLKTNLGIRVLLKSNYSKILPHHFKWLKKGNNLLNAFDNSLNYFLKHKLSLEKKQILNRLKNTKVEYLAFIDPQTRELIDKYNKNDLSYKTDSFFEWMKAYNWVQENHLLEISEKEKYAFSMYDNKFNISLIKIISGEKCIGFIVLQQRNQVCKLLFSYFDPIEHTKTISDIIILHTINSGAREIICYEKHIAKDLKTSNCIFKSYPMVKNSILSKKFNATDFDNVRMHFGDGDCSFA
jgi:hypothetical protein